MGLTFHKPTCTKTSRYQSGQLPRSPFLATFLFADDPRTGVQLLPKKPVTDRFRLTPGPRVLQLLPKSPPETRPIRRHAIQVSFSQQLPPTIYCGASLTLLLRFCTVLTLTAISVFSINAGLNTSASLKKICRAGAGLLSFIPKTYREC